MNHDGLMTMATKIANGIARPYHYVSGRNKIHLANSLSVISGVTETVLFIAGFLATKAYLRPGYAVEWLVCLIGAGMSIYNSYMCITEHNANYKAEERLNKTDEGLKHYSFLLEWYKTMCLFMGSVWFVMSMAFAVPIILTVLVRSTTVSYMSVVYLVSYTLRGIAWWLFLADDLPRKKNVFARAFDAVKSNLTIQPSDLAQPEPVRVQ